MKNVLAGLICAAALQGCAQGAAFGIRFPLGDPARGREAFLELECHACHDVEGLELPQHAGLLATRVTLGGHTPRIESYGDIVTSIVNPSHRLARDYRPRAAGDESPMEARYLNDVLTVQQLADVVAFLQDEYEHVPAPMPPYWESYQQPPDDPHALPRTNRGP